MKKLLCVLIVCLCFFEVTAQKFQDTIPFRNDLGLIIIPMQFNGVERQFVFDTGAQRTIAYEWAKESLKSTRKTITIVSSSGRRSRMRYYDSGTINIGSRKVTGHRILSTPSNTIFSCYKIDGILGVDIIKALNWKIDFKNKYLIMYPPSYLPTETDNMHELSFTFANNTPNVYLSRRTSRFKFLLDTGASGHSNISRKNYNLTGLDELPSQEIYSGSFDVNGIFTATNPKAFRMPEYSSREVTLRPIIQYDNLKSSKLGNKLWTGKSLFLALKKQKLWVSSSTIESTYKSYECSLGFNKGKMIVLKIHKDSAPWKAGLRQGDEVKAMNGKQFADFCSLYQYQGKLSAINQPFTLTLVNGKKIEVKKVEYLR